MKKSFFLVVTVVVLMIAMAGIAFAAAGDSTYLLPGTTGDAGSPHGAYDTTTKKCGVCHAVHHASGTGQALLRSSMAEGCSYCHIDTFTGYIKVYAGNSANYLNASNTAHDDASGVQCVRCHQVHAATTQMTGQAYLNKKILKLESAPQVAIDASNDATLVAESKYCSNCHAYFYTDYNQTSHVMTDLAGGYTNPGTTLRTNVAWTESVSCRNCHADGVTNLTPVPPATVVATSSFPHFTTGLRFLRSASTSAGGAVGDTSTAGSASSDGVCLRCHRNGSGTGIGQTF